MRITSWIHKAAIYCGDCKPDSRCSDDRCGDSECCPQPVFSTNDESDTPQHCAACKAFLQNALTGDGFKRLRENLSSPLSNEEVRAEWRSFYGLDRLREWPTLTSQTGAECLQEAITLRMRGVYGLYDAADAYRLAVGAQYSDRGSLFDAFVTAGNGNGIECAGAYRLTTAEALAKFCAACLSGQIVADDDGCILDRSPSDDGSWPEVAADTALAILSDEFKIELVGATMAYVLTHL